MDGGKDLFSLRPMAEDTVRYCAGDVVHLPALYDVYIKRISASWLGKVRLESGRRVAEAHAAGYDPGGQGKNLGPWPAVRGGRGRGRGRGGWRGGRAARRAVTPESSEMEEEVGTLSDFFDEDMGCYEWGSD